MLLEDASVRSRSVTLALNIEGWQHLDAVLLAALATEAPLLLIGPHGTAKTLLVERLSQALDLSFRHYNASLLNYDDLVGIPVPEEDNDSLRFVTTPGAIWDAEFVFFDEISRCRPDLQNKLFPIVHERRVLGLQLEKLRYRWAAMNPPSPDNPDFDKPASSYYLGSEPLDPALSDRFPFVVPVPDWNDLSREDRRRMLGRKITTVEANGAAPDPLSLAEMVQACIDTMAQVEADHSAWLVDYIIAVVDLLEKSELPQSPRRARMLIETIIAIHAARLVLEDEEAALSDSAEVALLYGVPQNSTEMPPTPASLVAIHRQAWEITHMLDDEIWRPILEETDQVQRVVMGYEMGVSDEDLAQLVTQALAAFPSEVRKVSLATAMFLCFRKDRHLTAAAWEPMVKLAGRVLMPRERSQAMTANAPNMAIWNEIKPWLYQRRTEGDLGRLEVNFVLGGYPEFWNQQNWQEALKQFSEDLERFGIEGVWA